MPVASEIISEIISALCAECEMDDMAEDLTALVEHATKSTIDKDDILTFYRFKDAIKTHYDWSISYGDLIYK